MQQQVANQLRKKTIHCEIVLYSGMSNYEIKEFIEQIIMSSIVNSYIWKGNVVSCKIIKDESVKPL
jgi:hypothetical protein